MIFLLNAYRFRESSLGKCVPITKSNKYLQNYPSELHKLNIATHFSLEPESLTVRVLGPPRLNL
jgi:hypothetical protein